MDLLVSVASADEVSAALAGGADFVDAKDPQSGALGAVSSAVLRDIYAAVGGARPVTAAIGDATDEAAIERTAFEFAAAGASFVKVGFAGIASVSRVGALAAAAQRGVAGACGLVLVCYVDAERSSSLGISALVDVAARAGARGVLLDTADKSGPGLCALLDPPALAAWVSRAHESGLFAALAGRLALEDLPRLRDTGADIAGVRGAACEGGRIGRVSTDKVRRLRAALVSGALVSQ
jgi:uncharacterized protein (UPF0264 family)